MEREKKEEPPKICRFCNKVIMGKYEMSKTKRKTTIYICEKCIRTEFTERVNK